jgi:hypothetical protein
MSLASSKLRVLADVKTIRRATAMHLAPGRAQFSWAAALLREPVSPFNQTDTSLILTFVTAFLNTTDFSTNN